MERLASMGPRPSASENLRPAQHRSGAPARFNGAEAIGLGKLARWRETVTIGIQLQWGRGHRPRKTLREGPSPPGRPCFNGAEAIGLGKPTTRSTTRLRSARFNGAEAIGLGKLTMARAWDISDTASMGPRPSATENTTSGSGGFRHTRASMGPRPSASENQGAGTDGSEARQASMGPRPSASENLTSDGLNLRNRSRFNGAEAIGLGKLQLFRRK